MSEMEVSTAADLRNKQSKKTKSVKSLPSKKVSKRKTETKDDDCCSEGIEVPEAELPKAAPLEPLKTSLPVNFKGRLGYACLNTVLRKSKPSVFCSRTCRIDTIKKEGIDFAKNLGRQNVLDLKKLVEWNEAHNIKFMRISSELFPFASHDIYGYSLSYCAKELREVGDLAAKLGHRLTTHPGQFNQLGSPTPRVVERTLKDLGYHAEMLDLMGLPPDSIMIIHMGGVYGDKAKTLARFEENYNALPEPIKKRLVIENDELCYSITDLLPICQKLKIPLVLDWHHHMLNPGKLATWSDLVSLVPQINQTWTNRGLRPKQHYSESRKGAVSIMERRAHSDRVLNFPPCDEDMDLMIEAKDKEQAVLSLYDRYKLQPVDPSAIVSPEEETKHTKGKKSSKKAKTKAESQE
eukprot:TRINITY_DN1938_c0_g1_i1.p1 TRINITY_DN1938_c0_g1~~TRINITY_DN1938_c0_g1_i1.p1  ORF type:complete len:408 (-),score=61.86 TRINITY_DN1938_c0_g1_i1:43-1266(-)